MTAPTCIIPARGISAELPKKNFKRIDGIPLVAYTIKSALDSTYINDVVVSTESEELARIAESHGANVPFLRPSELSEPGVLLNEVIEHTISELSESSQYTIEHETPIVILQPNVPFTRPEDIDAAIEKYQQNNPNPIISVTQERDYFWRRTNEHLLPLYEDRGLRSELEPIYRESGSIYVTNQSTIAGGDRVGQSPSYVITDKLSAFEVNTLTDFWLAERIVQGPDVVFRVDGGDDIGMGHIYRCITLARELREKLNSDIAFVTDGHYRGGVEKLQSTEFDVETVNGNDATELLVSLEPDIIFVDILNTDDEHIKPLHGLSAAVINLEDLGDGADHADYVINALYEREEENQNQLFGADYAVLDEKYYQQQPEINPDVENVLLTFGGSDPSNLSTKVANEIYKKELPYRYRIVIGPDFMHEEEFTSLANRFGSNIEVLRDISNMEKIMQWADVAVCSGGRTAYELAATGTPSIVIAHNDREMDRMNDLDAVDAIDFLGHAQEIDNGAVVKELITLDGDYERRIEMSKNAQEFVDGNGVQRILDLVYQIMVE